MLSFEEYIAIQETSYNPFEKMNWSKYNPGAYSAAGLVPGIPAAAASGAPAAWRSYRQSTMGSPFGPGAFESARNVVLNYVAKNPKLKQLVIDTIEEAKHYIQQGQKYQVGNFGNLSPQTPSTLGQVFALPKAVLTGLITSFTNILHTLDLPQIFHQPEEEVDIFRKNFIKMLQSLSSLSPEKAEEKASELLHVLSGGGTLSDIEAGRR